MHLGGRLVASITGTVPVYTHTDALGSVVRRSDGAGNEVGRSVIEPFGSLSAASSYIQGPGFTGHVADLASGLTYMQQRYQDPIAMRFLSVDPVHVDTTTGANFNRYWYANNNPYRYVDPDGFVSRELARQGYEDIGGGFVVRVDALNGPGGESYFEVHVYEDSKAFRRAAESGDLDGLSRAEVNTLDSGGGWGKHGKGGEAPDLGREGQAGLSRVVGREIEGRGWAERGPDGRLHMRENLRRNLGNFGRFLGPAGVLLEYTRSSVDRVCEIDQTHPGC